MTYLHKGTGKPRYVTDPEDAIVLPYSTKIWQISLLNILVINLPNHLVTVVSLTATFVYILTCNFSTTSLNLDLQLSVEFCCSVGLFDNT